MKKMFLILSILIFSLAANAQDEWYGVTIAGRNITFDLPTEYDDDTSIPSNYGTWEYELFTMDTTGSNITMMGKGGLSLNADGKTATRTVFLAYGEKKYVGIKLYFTRDADGIRVESPTVWSNDPAYCLDGKTFGIHWVKSPKGASNLRGE